MAHIEIHHSKDCCGCSVCVAVCPNDCIVMSSNSEGFLYPEVDISHCTECGLCTEICPWMKQPEISERIFPPQVYAAWHLNEQIRYKSSSGGVFTAIADKILLRKGVVVGAAFDNNMILRHVLVEDTNALVNLRGSKYVQSLIKPEIYPKIQSLLETGRDLLFSGTPCQIAALRKYLCKDYDNLVCCDLICHGVPSPKFFEKYISESGKTNITITKFGFRDKESGWKRFSIKKGWSDGSHTVSSIHSDPFIVSFLKNYSLRESCYECKFSKTSRYGDITLGDYWKVSTKYPEYDQDDKGTSLLLVNSKKGQTWLKLCQRNLFLGEGDLEHAISGNPMLKRPAPRPFERDTFFLDLSKMTVSKLRKRYHLFPKTFLERAFGFVKRRLKLKVLFK